MIKRGHLLILFSIVFISCFLRLAYLKLTLNEAVRTVKEIDSAFLFASECAASALKNHVYEDDVMLFVSETFDHSLSLAMYELEKDETISNSTMVEEISFSINGKMSTPEALKEIKDEDSIELYISLNDIDLKAGNEIFTISRNTAIQVRIPE